METELDSAHEQSVGAFDLQKTAAASGDATKAAFKDMEKKIARLADKLKMSEGLITELQADNGQIGMLREQLRSKNIAIKELSKHVEQLGGSVGSSPNVSPQRVLAEREGRGNLQNSAGIGASSSSRLAELKEENTRLKQALQVAAGSSGTSGTSPNREVGLNLSVESHDLMQMKLRSSNEEVASLQREVARLQGKLGKSSASNSPNKKTSPKKGGSPRSTLSPRESRVSPRK